MAKKTDSDLTLFHQAVGPVKLMKCDTIERVRPRSRVVKVLKSPFQDSSLHYEVSPIKPSAVESDEALWFARSGVSAKQLKKLKNGKLLPQAMCDLHNLRLTEAEQLLEAFLQEALQREMRVIQIIHGKSHGSEPPVLKNMVNERLREIQEILAFCSAPQAEGGRGATRVLLKNHTLDNSRQAAVK